MMEKNVPEIRFSKFEEEWKKEKFSNFALRISCTDESEELPRVEYEDIVSGEGTFNKNIYDKDSSKMGIVFLSGDVLYGKLRPYLKNIVLANFKGVAVGDFWVLRPINLNSEVLYTLVNTDKFNKIANVSSGSKMPRADWNLVSNSFFHIPTEPDEQRAIGTIFQSLDGLLVEQKNKLENLQKVKKAMLYKMFPHDGQNIPELRFEGFKGEWNEKKLGEIASEVSAGGDINKRLLKRKGKFPVIANALTNDGIVGYYEDYYRISSPAVTVTGRGEIGNAQARTINFTPVVRLLSIKSKLDVYFLANSINNLDIIIESTGVPQLTVPKMCSFHIKFPSLSEQRAIGSYFQTLDALIQENETKVTHLTHLKQALLQKMFA